jgi:hypothetical protein
MNNDFEFHPIADLFPLIDGEEFEALCADIKKNGLRQNVSIYEGKILDGRNRYRACKAVGEDIRTVPFYGDDPYEYVAAQNILRRHVRPSQRALIAAAMANMKAGDNQHSKVVPRIGETSSATALKEVTQICATSQQQAANLLNVSRRSVQSASQVLSKGAPELVAAVRSDVVSISAAAILASLPSQEQAEIVAKGPEAVTEAAKEVRELKKAESRNADAWKPGSNGRVPNDRVNILLRHWQLATPCQRQRFINHAVPSVGKEVSRVGGREF